MLAPGPFVLFGPPAAADAGNRLTRAYAGWQADAVTDASQPPDTA